MQDYSDGIHRLRFHAMTSELRSIRCKTALCWWPDNFWGLEILVEAPLGSAFAVYTPHGEPQFADFMNSTGFNVQLTAGLRLWTAWDWISVSMYYSKLVWQASEQTIRLSGSEYQHSAQNIKRPYPGVAVGLLGDILWIGFDYNVLFNGVGSNRDISRRESSQLAGNWTMSLSIAPITLARSAMGLVKPKT